MKKLFYNTVIAGMTIFLSGQEIRHDVTTINVEVPVRVFKGDRFCDHLTMQDFEVYEDGIPQKIEAVYLIKKTDVARKYMPLRQDQSPERYVPQVGRNFVLVFEITDYFPRTKEAVAYFFENVITPQDTLTVVTPVKTYRFNNKALRDIPKKKISSLLNETLRTDITTGCMEYHSMLREYKNLLDSPFSAQETQRLLIQKIREFREMRNLNESRIQAFADHLKHMGGQKFVFLFYQRELFPFPELPFEYLENLELMSELMTLVPQNIDKIKQRFSDSSITINFFYITQPQREIADEYYAMHQGTSWEDISSGIFSTFLEMAKATGGLTESSANIAFALAKGSIASENYYLLYYIPKNFTADGKFREIKVKVKDLNCRIIHRAGYLAD